MLVRVRGPPSTPRWHAVSGRPILVRLWAPATSGPRTRYPARTSRGVKSVGKNVTRFVVGDAVFGESLLKMQWRNGGTFAEYAAVPEGALQLKPENLSFEQAASVPTSGNIALINLMGDAEVRPGHSVLINGAGGGVGSIALQVAKARGATVTAVDRAEKLEMLRSLGADRVIDYHQEDFTRGDEQYDLILDVASTLALKDCKRVLKPTGIYLIIGHDRLRGRWQTDSGEPAAFFHAHRTLTLRPTPPRSEFLSARKVRDHDRVEGAARYRKDHTIIDRSFPLSEARAAMRYLQDGGGPGKIIITP